MLVVAAGLFYGSGQTEVDRSRAPMPASRPCSAAARRSPSPSLLSPGLASSSVGTYSGQVATQGFIRRRIPLFLRRALTMAPALVVLGLGPEPTSTLVL